MRGLRRIICGLSDWLVKLTNFGLGAIGTVLIVVTGYAVVMRYVFHAPPTWSHETSVLCFVWISFLGSANAMKFRAHIIFNFFIDTFPGKAYNFMVFLADVLTILTLVVGFVMGVKVAGVMFSRFFQTIPVPLGLLYTALPLGFLFMTIHALELLLEHWEIAVTNRGVIPKAVA
jgi:TRAP-type C4-dicarboxylate transport system permease small subunit